MRLYSILNFLSHVWYATDCKEIFHIPGIVVQTRSVGEYDGENAENYDPGLLIFDLLITYDGRKSGVIQFWK